MTNSNLVYCVEVAGYWGEFVVSKWGELVEGTVTSPTWDELVGRIDIAAK